MPRQCEWFQHVTAALEELEAFTAPVVDRAALERLLHVRRREAIRLMHKFGGYQAGKTFLIDRHALIRRLETIARGDEFERETFRRKRLADELDEVRQEQVSRRILIRRNPAAREIEGLPEGVHLERGRLEIRFRDTEELLRRLLELAQSIGRDFEHFRQRVEVG